MSGLNLPVAGDMCLGATAGRSSPVLSRNVWPRPPRIVKRPAPCRMPRDGARPEMTAWQSGSVPSGSGRPVARAAPPRKQTAPPGKEMAARRAIVAATQARRPPRRQRANRRDRPAASTPAGLALTAAGLTCTFAVHIRAGAVNVQTAGIIVMALGLAWLWIPVRRKRALLRRPFDRAMGFLAWDPPAAAACAALWLSCSARTAARLSAAALRARLTAPLTRSFACQHGRRSANS